MNYGVIVNTLPVKFNISLLIVCISRDIVSDNFRTGRCFLFFCLHETIIFYLKPRSHSAGMAPVHPGGGQPVYRDEPGHFC